MAEPFLAPGIAWMLVVLFSVLWIALGIWWGRQGKGDADADGGTEDCVRCCLLHRVSQGGPRAHCPGRQRDLGPNVRKHW